MPVKSAIANISSDVINDADKLRAYLLSHKVVTLRQELKDSNIPLTGLSIKALLVDRLVELQDHPIAPPPSIPKVVQKAVQGSSKVDVVNCSCGVNADDGKPMIQCFSCQQWSHIACYNLSQAAAGKITFLCKSCPASQSYVHLITSLTEQVNDLHHKVTLLSAQLNTHIKSCNSKLLRPQVLTNRSLSTE